MTIGLYTSRHYFDLKIGAIKEATKKLSIDADIVLGDSFRPSLVSQTFGFEDMFKRAQECADEALKRQNTDIGIGIENSISFFNNANEWYYVIGISIKTKDGKHADSFTSGIRVPGWMMEQIQKDNLKMDSLTQSLAKEDDPVMYFSGGTITRKDLMVPALLLAFANLNLDKRPTSA